MRHAHQTVMRAAAPCGLISTPARPFLGCGTPVACSHSHHRRQVLAVADGALAGRLTHRLARRPLRRHTTRRSALPRRVMRAKALPDRVQAPPGLSGSTRGTRSPSPDQPRRGFHSVRKGLNPPTLSEPRAEQRSDLPVAPPGIVRTQRIARGRQERRSSGSTPQPVLPAPPVDAARSAGCRRVDSRSARPLS